MMRNNRDVIDYWKRIVMASVKFGVNSQRFQDIDPELLSHRRIVNYRNEPLRNTNQLVVENYSIHKDVWIPMRKFPPRKDPVLLDNVYTFYEAFLDDICESSVIAVATQSSAKLSYGDMVSTIQVSTGQNDYIIDAFRIPFEIREKLKMRLEDPEKLVVMHDGRQDVIFLKSQFQIFPVGVFDTAVYHQVMTGGPIVSLDHLTDKYFNQSSMGERNMCSKVIEAADWSIRPLPMAMMIFCQDRTHNLLLVFNEIFSKASRNDVITTIEAFKSELLRPVRATVVSSPEKDLRKLRQHVDLFIKGSKERYINLWCYRDLLAKYLDRNPYEIVSTRTLVKLAGIETQQEEIILNIIYGDLGRPKNHFVPRQCLKSLVKVINEGKTALDQFRATLCHGCSSAGHPGWACWKECVVWKDKKDFFDMPGHKKFKASENRRHERRKTRKFEYQQKAIFADPDKNWEIQSVEEDDNGDENYLRFDEIMEEIQQDIQSESTLVDWYDAASIISSAASSCGYETAEEDF